MLGTFAVTSQSLTGGVMQMVNHGLSTGALFLLVGWIYERRHTRQIAELGGIQSVAPIFAAGFMVVMLSSIGVPGLNGFVGEYLILIGSFLTARWWTVVAAAGVILAALYLLWAYQRVFHGEADDDNRTFPELQLRERPRAARRSSASSCSPASTPSRCSTASSPASTASIAHVEARTGRTHRRCPRRAELAEDEADARRDRVIAAGPSQGPDVDWFALSPLLVLVGAALFLLLVGALTPPWPRGLYAVVTAVAAGAAGVLAMVLWDDITDDGPTTLVGGALAFDTFALFVTITICVVVVARRASTSDDYLRREAPRRSRGLRAVPRRRRRRRRDGVGQRPDRAVPRSRDAVARASTSSPPATAAGRAEPRAASSTSSSAASRRRSSSTASP